MQQILEGVSYLHSRSIVHRDIKPENVLCTGKTWPLQVKLTDFGLSNFLSDSGGADNSMLLSHVGTSYYIAPEIVGKGGYGPGVDVWACGVVLYVSIFRSVGLMFADTGVTNSMHLTIVTRIMESC